ncbi:MAG: GTA-gp10 family protein [Rhodothalassiaceae bacterium]
MSAANPLRGEVALELGGRSHVLRPSFAALLAIESEVAPLLVLAQEAAEGRVRVEAMATVFHHCLYLEDGAARPTVGEIGEVILADGLMPSLKAYRALIENVLMGPAPDRDG